MEGTMATVVAMVVEIVVVGSSAVMVAVDSVAADSAAVVTVVAVAVESERCIVP